MDDRNPYAPSKASLNQSASPSGQVDSRATAWRYGTILVMLPDSALPDRCVKCNQPAAAPTKARKVYWHHPGVYAVILINLIVYAVVAAIVRKRAIIAPGLCQEHKKRRRQGIAIAWGTFFFGLVMIFLDFGTDGSSALIGIGLLFMLLAALIGIFRTRIVYAQKIETNRVWLKGCGGEFLDSLPELPPG